MQNGRWQVFRDSIGKSLLIHVVNFSTDTNNSAEARAMLWSLMITRQKGWRKLWIEGNTKLVIGVVKGGNINNWRLEMVIDVAKCLIDDLDEVKILHIGRTGNRVVD
ncbi:hypothetical protein SUGI_0625870 [Cryptomeria japonica]|nr:hypothetical protein SUGI_0625870 [Cryptomeria japonica]